MKSIYSNLLLLLLFSLVGWKAQAQLESIKISEPLSIRNDFGYEIIGELRDRVLLFRDKYDEYEIQGYDKDMNFSFERELDFEKRGVKILAVVGSKNDFSIFYRMYKKGKTTLRINKYDPGANLIDTLTIKEYGERKFRVPNLDVVKSADKNCIGIFNTTERDKLEIVCLQIDKMKVLWDKAIVLEDDFFDSNKRAIVLGNKGELCVVSEFNNRKNRVSEHHYRTYRNIQGKEYVSRVELPNILTTDAFFAYDNLNGRLSCGGLYSDRNTQRVHGAFFWNVEGDNANLKTDDFDERFISQVRGKNIEDENRGIVDVEVVDMIFRKDGGVALFCEKRETIGRGLSSSRGIFRDAPRMVMDYYYDDIFTVTFDGSGERHWRSVMQKKQYSQDDEAIFSSFFLMRAPESLHLLYNDEIRYENTCSEYILFPDGNFRRRSLLNTSEKRLRIRFRDGLQVGPRVVILPSEFRNKLSLVRVEY